MLENHNPNAENILENSNITTNTGSLVVFVLDAGGALPVSGAKVSIFNSGKMEGEPVAVLTSGENGKTNAIYLSVPQINSAEVPARETTPFTAYDILVELNGYYNVISRNIPVYPSVTTIQPIYMVPKPMGVNAVQKHLAQNGAGL